VAADETARVIGLFATNDSLASHLEPREFPWQSLLSACTIETVKYFKRHWNVRRGDDLDGWGVSTWFLETDASGYPSRQVEVYANGRVLVYDSVHSHDRYGGLSHVSVEFRQFARFEITKSEFEKAWSTASPFNR
jgi:hypothetical protein